MAKSEAASISASTENRERKGIKTGKSKDPFSRRCAPEDDAEATLVSDEECSSDPEPSDGDDAASETSEPDDRPLATRVQSGMIDSFDEVNEDDKVQWAASPIVRQVIDNACRWFQMNHNPSETPEDAINTRDKGLEAKE